MKHISQIGLIKKVPKLNKYQAKEVWKLTKELLPADCPLKNEGKIAYEALVLVSYLYLRKEPFVTDKICTQCAQEARDEYSYLPYLHRIFCPRRTSHLH